MLDHLHNPYYQRLKLLLDKIAKAHADLLIDERYSHIRCIEIECYKCSVKKRYCGTGNVDDVLCDTCLLDERIEPKKDIGMVKYHLEIMMRYSDTIIDKITNANTKNPAE